MTGPSDSSVQVEAAEFAAWYASDTRPFDERDCSPRKVAWAAWQAARRAALPVAHSDHPMRHWDRTCPACNPHPCPPLPVAALSDADRELMDALNGLSQVRKSLHEANEAAG